MCGVIGGFRLVAPMDHSYSELCKNSITGEIISQLLKGLSNRGHESVGLVMESSNDIRFVEQDTGTVSDFLNTYGVDIDYFLKNIDLKDFIGHIRYATSSGTKIDNKSTETNNIHPIFIGSDNYNLILAENGQTYSDTICIHDECVDGYLKPGMLNRYGATNDTSFKGMRLLDILENSNTSQKSFHDILLSGLDTLYDETFDNGMFSTLGQIKDKVSGKSYFVVMRDGGRPLYQFDLDGFRIFCSESSAITDIMQNLEINLDAKNIMQFPSGGISVYDLDLGTSFNQQKEAKPDCFFEYAYLMNQNTFVPNINYDLVKVDDIRATLGIQTLEEHPEILNLLKNNKDCMLSSVPNSGLSYTKLFKDKYGIDDTQFITRNPNYDYRTFIASDDPKIRLSKANDKFIISPDVKGKKVVIFDDSLVRYNVASVLNKKLRKAGAEEVYYLFATPPIISPCYGGINTYRKDLAVTAIEKLSKRKITAKAIGIDYYGTGAHKGFENALKSFEHEQVIMDYLGGPVKTDGVGFLSIAGLNKVFNNLNLPPPSQCCVTGKYPYKFDGIEDWDYVPSKVYNAAITHFKIYNDSTCLAKK
ncbi:MAG: hypothetical protein K0B07_04530 [DPANN group archaeon]|nr:hypothetical protein [DPANN group archaeon]